MGHFRLCSPRRPRHPLPQVSHISEALTFNTLRNHLRAKGHIWSHTHCVSIYWIIAVPVHGMSWTAREVPIRSAITQLLAGDRNPRFKKTDCSPAYVNWTYCQMRLVKGNIVGRDSSVGIATRYGLDGAGIGSRKGGGCEIFLTRPDRPRGPPSLL